MLFLQIKIINLIIQRQIIIKQFTKNINIIFKFFSISTILELYLWNISFNKYINILKNIERKNLLPQYIAEMQKSSILEVLDLVRKGQGLMMNG